MKSLLAEYVRLTLESAPSRLKLQAKELSVDSSERDGFQSHLDQPWIEPPDEEDIKMAQHLEWGEMLDPEVETEDLGPVPPAGMDPRALPDPFVRGQYDNVTWEH